MRRLITMTLFFLISFVYAYDQDLRPIEAWEYEYISQAFPTAGFLKLTRIEDSPLLTSGEPNTFLTIVYDHSKTKLGYVREVYTSAGCVDVCSPLDFTISFDHLGKFLMVIRRDQMPLEKDFGYDVFNLDDYKKLHMMLVDTPDVFTAAEKPTDLVDATTSATKLEYVDYVVETAAMSCFKIYLYKMQTEAQLINF